MALIPHCRQYTRVEENIPITPYSRVIHSPCWIETAKIVDMMMRTKVNQEYPWVHAKLFI